MSVSHLGTPYILDIRSLLLSSTLPFHHKHHVTQTRPLQIPRRIRRRRRRLLPATKGTLLFPSPDTSTYTSIGRNRPSCSTRSSKRPFPTASGKRRRRKSKRRMRNGNGSRRKSTLVPFPISSNLFHLTAAPLAGPQRSRSPNSTQRSTATNRIPRRPRRGDALPPRGNHHHAGHEE